RPLRLALSAHYEKTFDYPKTEEILKRELAEAGIDFKSLTDPWGTTFRPLFFVDKQSDVLLLQSAGADKQFDTDDDFSTERLGWPYFRSAGETIDRAVSSYHLRTGTFIRDINSLRDELNRHGFNLDA